MPLTFLPSLAEQEIVWPVTVKCPRPYTISVSTTTALKVYRDVVHFVVIGCISWWRHQMETFSALLAICAGNSPVTGEFPAQRPVTRSFDILFDMRLNKRLSKRSWGWWFETPWRPLWHYCSVRWSWWPHQMQPSSQHVYLSVSVYTVMWLLEQWRLHKQPLINPMMVKRTILYKRLQN